MEKLHYIDETDTVIVENIYDPSAVLAENAEIRKTGPVVLGEKGQQLVLAMRIDMEHVQALKNIGYNILSKDPDERRRAMLYVQAHQRDWLTTDKKMIAERHQKWV